MFFEKNLIVLGDPVFWCEKKRNIFKSILKFSRFKMAYLLMDSIKDFSCDFIRKTRSMFWN
jgi:hypothetical protein